MRSYCDFQKEARSGVEFCLAHALSIQASTVLRMAAEYVTLGGGHRWRALMVIAAGTVFRRDGLEAALPGACGVELAHVASLVLDDFPSMDDARSRRGKPCVHLQFPASTVDMLPTYLLNAAYRSVLTNPLVDQTECNAAAIKLAETGAEMFAGQELDLQVGQVEDGNGKEQRLWACYRQKTAALFSAGATVGAILCGADASQTDTLGKCGTDLGLAYQLRDDVADVVGREEDLGKATGMDECRFTAVDLLGVDGARGKANRLVECAMDRLAEFGSDADLLRELIRDLTVGGNGKRRR